VVSSAIRKNSYSERESFQNDFYWSHIKSNPKLREEILAKVAVRLQAESWLLLAPGSLSGVFRSFRRGLWLTICVWLKIRPDFVVKFFRNRKKGGMVNWLRVQRGLDELKEK
jgi:hypothetical protein